jgi:nicotinate-nucleotide pyrophosphorylase (carboxylating)
MNYYNKIIIQRKLKEYLEEDCNFIDISALCIPKETNISAKIVAKSEGFISGLEELGILYDILKVTINFFKKDGDAFKNGDIIAELRGYARAILMGERVGLNLLIHMSSITSTVKKYVKIIKDSGKNVKIACTRKTLPGLRIFEKKAVLLVGDGADPHRFSLSDMILLKDTHLKYYKGDIAKLLKNMKKQASFTKKIEIEIEKPEEVLIAAKNGADIIMLDNMTPNQVEDAINLLKKNNLRDKVIIEVSGGINIENIVDYLQSSPDIISIGELTQFPSEKVDFSLRFD